MVNARDDAGITQIVILTEIGDTVECSWILRLQVKVAPDLSIGLECEVEGPILNAINSSHLLIALSVDWWHDISLVVFAVVGRENNVMRCGG